MAYIFDKSRSIVLRPKRFKGAQLESNGKHSIVIDEEDRLWMTVPKEKHTLLYPMKYDY